MLEPRGGGASGPGRGGLGVRQHCLRRGPRESGRGGSERRSGLDPGGRRAGPGRRRRCGRVGRPGGEVPVARAPLTGRGWALTSMTCAEPTPVTLVRLLRGSGPLTQCRPAGPMFTCDKERRQVADRPVNHMLLSSLQLATSKLTRCGSGIAQVQNTVPHVSMYQEERFVRTAQTLRPLSYPALLGDPDPRGFAALLPPISGRHAGPLRSWHCLPGWDTPPSVWSPTEAQVASLFPLLPPWSLAWLLKSRNWITTCLCLKSWVIRLSGAP